ncbi:MAG: ATP-binding protein [Desulfobacterales bacterium]|nr:ATP-binding protein [Desulfobacterales bacterium]
MGSNIKKRHAADIIFSKIFGRQMRFIAGPRQCGKTTLAKQILTLAKNENFYYNWDKKEVRDRYRKEHSFLSADILNAQPGSRHWVCLDEIHKFPNWKNILKDFFDTHEDKINFIVTGSARLDLLRKSGDCLAGRYFLFNLNPFILAELLDSDVDKILPENNGLEYIEKMIANKKFEQDFLDQIVKFSGFPEPLLHQNSLFAKKWHDSYLERIVKEDIRDLSHIRQIEKVMDLIFLLPDKIASPLSINSLRKDLELNFNTVKNYINYLILGYVLFALSPFHKKNTRLVKKEKKIYFYDWAVIQDKAKRFENFVAMELKTRIDTWNDRLEDDYDLMYVRTKDGKESDFLILKNKNPYVLFEVKLSSSKISKHHYLHSKLLGNVPFVQLVKEDKILKVENKNFYIVSASRFFA